MILFTCMIYLQWMWWEWEKNPEIYTKTKEKSPVWLPSHPPVYKIGGRLFSGAKEPETSRTYPRWGRDPNLQGWKEIRGRARYGLTQAGDMIFIHMNVQDFQ